LTNIYLTDTNVTGDIDNLKSPTSLTNIFLGDTDVYGDKEAFHEYRETAGLPECYILM